ncbi:MAG: DUF2461 domain-containing protein [Muribaculaceae bacterium]|nr:DUF2461 domain-containing protein [Muribaculaceae bacterium]
MSKNYASDLFLFLKELEANNNRLWFNANKERYNALRNAWIADIDSLIAHMSQWDSDLASQNASDCIYRIYRDTRFSPDKTPYKTYFSAAISPWGRKTNRAAYYLQFDINSEQCGLYGGLWCPDTSMLTKLRHAIVDNIEEWEEIVNQSEITHYFPGWIGARLATAPKGWNRNHPQIEYLRLRDYGKFHQCPPTFFYDHTWPQHAAELFHILKPIIDFLNYSLDEEI